jgi:hypothetical protein
MPKASARRSRIGCRISLCAPAASGNARDIRPMEITPHAGLRCVGERSEPTREPESVAGRAKRARRERESAAKREARDDGRDGTSAER